MENPSNPVLDLFKTFIGKKLDRTPSGAGSWLSGSLIDVDHHHIKVSYKVRPDMCNPAKVLHGGVISLMLDDVIGMGNMVVGSEHLMTSINLNVDFLSSAAIGETLEVSAKLIRTGGNVNHWEGVIRKESGKVVAKASSNLIKTHVKLSDLGF